MRETKHNTKASPQTPDPVPKASVIKHLLGWVHALFWVTVIFMVLSIGAYTVFTRYYQGKIYPNVYIDGISFGGQTPDAVRAFWQQKNSNFPNFELRLQYDDKVATISGADLSIGYDATLSAIQAYDVGRSSQWLSSMYTTVSQKKVDLKPYFRWNTQPVDDALAAIADDVNIPVQDALFQFQNNKVTSFKPSKDGRALNVNEANLRIQIVLYQAAHGTATPITVRMPIDTIQPSVTTDKANSFGIKSLIATGYSEFAGSIAGRIHNVALAASRINGLLIKPGETFSFNDAVGDISAATGYQSAYIIKDGHTVLGDGGGVCQVSTTLFRAALAAGLPIVERHAHDYRVHYYEEGGFKAGMDATVYGPTYDLKFKNDTPGYILIQTKTDLTNLSLTFELYGTNDGRAVTISNQKLWDVTAPPPDLYQDDPTLPKGTTKQVDFSAWGAKASFDYLVMRGSTTLEKTTFFSNFRPWQAVYLRGTL